MIFDRTQDDVDTAILLRDTKVKKFEALTESEIETLEKGTLVLNNATSRFGNQIWMMIGADRWVCADTGFCAYIEEIPQSEKHIQINYKPNNSYISVVNLNVRVKPQGKIVETLPSGTIRKNLATTRIGDEIWMNIGKNKWICADNGKKSYMV